MSIGIIACSKQKLARTAPAAQLYTSPLFRMSLEYASHMCSTVYIASALHELVALDDKLKPYNFEMRDRGGKREREAWGERIAGSLVSRHGQTFDVLMLAGELYAGPIRGGLYVQGGFGDDGWRGRLRYRVSEPLKGMQIGQRLAWLSKQIAQLQQQTEGVTT